MILTKLRISSLRLPLTADLTVFIKGCLSRYVTQWLKIFGHNLSTYELSLLYEVKV
jgi:hypothetical protein